MMSFGLICSQGVGAATHTEIPPLAAHSTSKRGKTPPLAAHLTSRGGKTPPVAEHLTS
jgi:hypothetical protein